MSYPNGRPCAVAIATVRGLFAAEAAFAANDVVFLHREPDNEHDSNAISVRTCQSARLGYVAREAAALLTPLLGMPQHYTRFRVWIRCVHPSLAYGQLDISATTESPLVYKLFARITALPYRAYCPRPDSEPSHRDTKGEPQEGSTGVEQIVRKIKEEPNHQQRKLTFGDWSAGDPLASEDQEPPLKYPAVSVKLEAKEAL